MIQGTTPTLRFKVANADLFEDLESAKIILKVMGKTVVKAGNDIDIDPANCYISAHYTEEETMSLSASNGYAQLRVKLKDGTLMATKKKPVNVDELLENEVF